MSERLVDLNGRPIFFSYRVALLLVTIVGFVFVILLLAMHLMISGDMAQVATNRSTRAIEVAAQSSTEHGRIEDALQLIAIITASTEVDRAAIRWAILAQASPGVRRLVDSAIQQSEERRMREKAIPRQPDESPDSKARERRPR